MSHVIIERKTLVKALKVLELVPKVAGVPSSDFIKATTRKASLQMSVSSNVTAVVRVSYRGSTDQKEFFIDRGLFAQYILAGEKWKGDFTLTLDDTRAYMEQGSRKGDFVLRSEAIGGYGQWREKDGHEEIKLSDELRGMLMASFGCAADDPSMPHLNCVFIHGQVVMSTNERSAFLGRRDSGDKLRIPFPVGIIPLLGGDLVNSVSVDGDRVVLDCGCGYIEGAVSAPAKKDFPKSSVEKLVDGAQKYPVFVRLPSEKILNILERLSGYLTSVKREDQIVTLQLEPGRVLATVQVTQGKFEESTKIPDLKQEGKIKFLLQYVLPAIRYIASNGDELIIRALDKKPYLLSNKMKNADVEVILGRLS